MYKETHKKAPGRVSCDMPFDVANARASSHAILHDEPRGPSPACASLPFDPVGVPHFGVVNVVDSSHARVIAEEDHVTLRNEDVDIFLQLCGEDPFDAWSRSPAAPAMTPGSGLPLVDELDEYLNGDTSGKTTKRAADLCNSESESELDFA